jgi:hypothetical protein
VLRNSDIFNIYASKTLANYPSVNVYLAPGIHLHMNIWDSLE